MFTSKLNEYDFVVICKSCNSQLLLQRDPTVRNLEHLKLRGSQFQFLARCPDCWVEHGYLACEVRNVKEPAPMQSVRKGVLSDAINVAVSTVCIRIFELAVHPPFVYKPVNMSTNPLDPLFDASREFARSFSARPHNELRGVTDGKAVGTYVEHGFQQFLIDNNVVEPEDIGSSAKGIDLPNMSIDIKVTSIRQPQSSSPFKSFKQKIEGLGYHLILFVYEKTDTPTECYIKLLAVRFIPSHRTADYQTTKGILSILERGGNADDIFAFLVERMIPVDEDSLMAYAEWLVAHPPVLGYLTISNALQWRLQYRRVITNNLEDVVNLDAVPHGDLAELIPEKPVITPIDEDE